MRRVVEPVFIFDRNGDAEVFASIDEAREYLEPEDVADGEYEAIYTLDGRVVRPGTVNLRGPDVVTLTPADQHDEDDLRERLRRYVATGELRSSPGDPVAVANEMFQQQWESRWPRWPRWLDRRLHGDGPAYIGTVPGGP